jgi:hypothetical protein
VETGAVPAIQRINDAKGVFGDGEMEDGIGRLVALAAGLAAADDRL